MTGVAPPRRCLSGGPVRADFLAIEHLVRPRGIGDRGITFLDGLDNRRLSYDELAGLAAAVADQMRRLGVRPGTRVATTIGNDLSSVLAVLGIWTAGACVVSIPPAPRRGVPWYSRYFGSLLRAADCELLLSDSMTPEDGGHPFGRADLRVVSKERLCGDVSPMAAGSGDERVDGTALIQFTSGSLSAPKGIAIEAGTLARHIGTIVDVLAIDSSRDRFVSWLPLYHDMGLLTMFAVALASRTDIVLMSPSSFATGPARWLTTLAQERATVTAAPNFAYRLAATVPYEEGLDLSSVRISLTGSERVCWQTLVDFHRVTEPLGFAWGALMPSYGLAEGVVGATNTPLGRGPIKGPGHHVSVGVPIPGLRFEAPDGLPSGPITLSGAWVFEGYLTTEGFVPAPADGSIDTGDYGFVHGGECYVIGRRAEVVAAAGRNVFAEDIETVVHDTEGPNVRACAAFRLADDDQQFGLMVEVPPRPRRTPVEVASLGAGIRASVSSALGIRLHTVLMVRTGTIPRTTSGKAQRAECRAMHATAELTRRLLTTIN